MSYAKAYPPRFMSIGTVRKMPCVTFTGASPLSQSSHSTDLKSNKGHDKHIHYDECAATGLKMKRIEDEKIQDLVLTIHHCYTFSLSNSAAFKIIENHLGRRYVKLHLMAPQAPVTLQLPPDIHEAMVRGLEAQKASAPGSSPIVKG